MFNAFCAQCNAITAPKQLAMPVVATGVVIDPIAVADGEAGLGAIPPDCTLDEPWKRRRESGIELAGVDVGCEQMENPGATIWPVTPIPVRMVGVQSLQDPRAMQKVMNQGVDSHEGRPDFKPQRPSAASCQQQVRQRHRQDLVGNAVDVPEWANDGFAQGSEPVWSSGVGRATGYFLSPIMARSLKLWTGQARLALRRGIALSLIRPANPNEVLGENPLVEGVHIRSLCIRGLATMGVTRRD